MTVATILACIAAWTVAGSLAGLAVFRAFVTGIDRMAGEISGDEALQQVAGEGCVVFVQHDGSVTK